MASSNHGLNEELSAPACARRCCLRLFAVATWGRLKVTEGISLFLEVEPGTGFQKEHKYGRSTFQDMIFQPTVIIIVSIKHPDLSYDIYRVL